MSDPARNAKALSVTEQAADWLERREACGWTDDDARLLQAWLDESESHCAAFWRLEEAWNQSSRLAALREMHPARVTPASRPRFWPVLGRMVAAIAILAVAGVASKIYFSPPQGDLYTTPVGGREILTLADGSQIELNTDTSLRVNFASGRRAVTLLRGEAYFQVRHDSARPFTVTAGNHRIVDLGTKFVVRRETEKLEVALMEGRASVEDTSAASPDHPAVLVPGDVAVVTAAGVTMTKKSDQQLKDSAAWRKGMLVFDGARLSDAAAEFNRYNATQLVVVDDVAARKTLGGTFPTNDLEDFTHLAQSVLGLHVRRENGRIAISR
jgi:transmembrane sensor